MAQVASGDFFNNAERLAIDTTIRKSEQLCRFEFSVYVGDTDGAARPFATRLHNTLVAPTKSILILVDPTSRVLEIVTGAAVRRKVSDTEIEHVVTAMQALFAEGHLADGLRQGISQIAEHAHASV
ncbi:DUF5130 family protein [Nocardioides sp. JQ2195]|uniref:DUF5130 family protein n=1 Tax=Nocardioides sp. JQ2195 TaxID=2592334 RepID=UPI00143E70F9|nr:DUF5130 family protein [Nocardioides sp. JQ2195]QIX26054.1 DUF5130 family protein [Nocardioides sp. JQ2195]